MLANAQELGFAERNPSADVSGKDSLSKLVILLRLAFGAVIQPDSILCEGIEDISPLDIAYAEELGYRIKLLAIAKDRDGRLEARVHPAMIPIGSVMANVKFEYNAIEVVGEEFGTQIFYGKGAGQRPTATVVASDTLDIASRIANGVTVSRVDDLLDRGNSPQMLTAEELSLRYYVRLEVHDKTGVLAEIARVFAVENISIESVIQKSRAASDTVPLVVMTHEANEAALGRALDHLAALKVVHGHIQRIRVEEL
jgi:homoserine dehydrogenase